MTAAGGLIRESHRTYEINDRCYTARRLPRSPHDWAILDDRGMFLFLIHYRTPKKKYYRHGNRGQSNSIEEAIRQGLRGN